MYPTTNHQILAVDIVEQFRLSYICGLACVARRGLVWNDEMRYEERVRNESTTKDAAGLEV